jgi:hypothetical protein
MGDSAVGLLHFLWAILSEERPLIHQAVGEREGCWTRLCGLMNVRPEEGGAGTPPEVSPSLPAAAGPAPTVLADDKGQAIGTKGHVKGPAEDHAEGEVIPPKADEKKAPATPFLDKFGRDLTRLARAGELSPCIGRKDEMRTIAQILCRRGKNNPILVGDAGVGKT